MEILQAGKCTHSKCSKSPCQSVMNLVMFTLPVLLLFSPFFHLFSIVHPSLSSLPSSSSFSFPSSPPSSFLPSLLFLPSFLLLLPNASSSLSLLSFSSISSYSFSTSLPPLISPQLGCNAVSWAPAVNPGSLVEVQRQLVLHLVTEVDKTRVDQMGTYCRSGKFCC